MRSLYWKFFISFWLASIAIILTIAWITGRVTQSSSVHAFMDGYANAAVIMYETGQNKALTRWLEQTGKKRQMQFFLLINTGEVITTEAVIPANILKISQNLVKNQLNIERYQSPTTNLSHEILATTGLAFHLVATSKNPLAVFVEIPWGSLSIHLLAAIGISGFICYLLSLYLTKPLRALREAAKSLAAGNLDTRVGIVLGHQKDEIADLSREFDSMATQLEHLVRSKERLLQDISHELRSPLARLQIAIALGLKKTNNLANAEFDRMELECSRLNSLIGEMLDYARADKVLSHLELQLVDLPELIAQIVSDSNYEFASTDKQAIIDSSTTCNLYIDARLIYRAIENVLRNALRYSPPHTPVVLALNYNEDKTEICLDILDRGPGVPQVHLQKIFDPFYRVDAAREKNTGGYGLGLAIAFQAIKAHNGSIFAKNRIGGGLQISICLPNRKA